MPSVTWVLSNSKYEVSSIDHLMCIAAIGSGYTCSGSIPANYMTASYRQTANINCVGQTMGRIGTYSSCFTGSYDGQNYEIKNWQNNQTVTADQQGLFGAMNAGATIQNILMTGLIKLKVGTHGGIVIGYADSSNIRNISVICASGSTIIGTGQVGGIVGYNFGQLTKISISGYLNITCTSNGIGGILGYGEFGGSVVDGINSIIGNITGGGLVGGIVGYTRWSQNVGLINNMIGNIIGSGDSVGGIGNGGSAENTTIKFRYCFNNMTGNIQGNKNVGGIIGLSDSYIEDCINIMTGNIICTNAATVNINTCGGIGLTTLNTYNRCLLAMNGNCPSIFTNNVSSTATTITKNIYSNRFGMTVNNSTLNSYILANKVSLDYFPTGDWYLQNNVMWDINTYKPYWVYTYTLNSISMVSRAINNNIPYQTITISNLTNTNITGNVTLTWIAISGYTYYKILLNSETTNNIVGVSSTTELSCTINNLELATIHTASIYASVDNNTFINTGLLTNFTTISLSTLTKTVLAQTTLNYSWTSVSGITNYRITSKAFNISETISISSTTDLTGTMTGLQQDTKYILTLEGSADNVNFIRLCTPQTHTTNQLVTWILTNSYYEISSIIHFKCIASKGLGFYITSSVFPADYSTANYIQVNNIDCTGQVMIPIGNTVWAFNGIYNGQNYEIQNWQNDQSSTSNYQGIFGYTGGCSIYNLQITGVTKVVGGNNCGILVGSCNDASIYNITINCSSGSILTGTSYVGGLLGYYHTANTGTVNNINITGFLNITNTGDMTGGIIGKLMDVSGTLYLGNYNLSITGNIRGVNWIGGMIGFMDPSNTGGGSPVYIMKNFMTGNIIGTGVYIGGLIGYCQTGGFSCGINNMTGNIQGNDYIGGIVGYTTSAFSNVMNIMIGTIIASATNKTNCGGIGYCSFTPWYDTGVMLVATKGDLYSLFGGNRNPCANTQGFVFSNKFGMTINNQTITSSTNWEYSTLDSLPISYASPFYVQSKMNNWDTLNNLPYWINSYSGKSSTNATLTYTITAQIPYARFITYINWVYSNGFYQIPDTNHLTTMIQEGNIYLTNPMQQYSNIGTVPTDWFNSSYKQTSNIDLNNFNMLLLSYSSNYFSGTYDGQNLQIQNLLYANNTSNQSGNSYAALFPKINNANIKNTILNGSLNVYGTDSNQRANISYGGIVHTASSNNMIQNCKVLANGTIYTDSNISLICNQMIGSNNIIANCTTNYIGTIDTTAKGQQNTSGIILGKGNSINSSYVLHCTNQNIGSSYLGEYYGGGIVGTNATVFGCINKSIGNLNGHINSNSYFTSAIIGNGKAFGCINDINGHIGSSNKSSNIGGISGAGDVDYCINCMTGNLNSNTGYGISKLGKVTNSFNFMYGDSYEAIGGDITSSNNYCAMSGMVYHISNSNYKQYYATQKYGFSNNIAKITIRDDIWNLFQTNSNITFFDEINLPVLQSNLTLKLNNSNYTGPASNWEISFPNNNSNYTQFKYQYNSTTRKYTLLKQVKGSGTITSTTPIIADGTNSNALPYYLISLVGTADKTNYTSNLNTIISTNSNVKNFQEASVFFTLSNQLISSIPTNNGNKIIDLGSFSNSLSTYKDVYKPAIKNVLQNAITESVAVIKNINNTVLFDNILKIRDVDKLYVKPTASLASNDVDALFSNQNDLLLLENTTYSLNLNGPILTIDTSQATASNYIDIIFNGSNHRLDSNNKFVNLEISPGIWKGFEVNGMGSGSFNGFDVIYTTYTNDDSNNYLISDSNQFLCAVKKGYGYQVTNPPTDYSIVNYKQTSNIDLNQELNVFADYTFKGIYDGDNKYLKNLIYTNNINSNLVNYALFPNIDGAIIKNLTLNGSLNVYSESGSNIAGNISYGGLVYSASNNCLIDNCIVDTTGIININSGFSLICYNMVGQYGIIKNCLTKFNGSITCGDYSANILANGSSSNNSFVLFSTVSNNGNFYTGNNSGIIAGQNATVFGSLNVMKGDFKSLSNSAGIIQNGLAIACINSMQGNINNGNYNAVYEGGIIDYGRADYCINSMLGSIFGDYNTCGAIGTPNGILYNCLNIMKGGVSGDAIGGSTVSGNTSNNVCAMNGKASKSTNINYSNFGITDYGFNNSVSGLPIISTDNITNKLPNTSYYKYNYDIKLPYLPINLTFTVNGSNYTSYAPSWHTTYPNLEILDTKYNIYANKLYNGSEVVVKMNINDFNNTNLSEYIMNYQIPAKLYNWNFSWNEQTPFTLTNMGFGTSNPQKQVDVSGDIKFSGLLYKNNNLIGNWNNTGSSIYYNKGFVGINTTPQYELDIVGDIRTNTRLTNSDSRLKDDITNETLGINYINTLEPKTFSYINNSNNNIFHGFIAQDILSTSNNDFVSIDNSGFYNIDLTSFIAPIVKSIQELAMENELIALAQN